jgi:hypothetical protein
VSKESCMRPRAGQRRDGVAVEDEDEVEVEE